MACEEDIDFDEDIIFPNSPLGCYVQGLENSEATNLYDECFSVKNNSQECTEKNTQLTSKKDTFSLKDFFVEGHKMCVRFLSLLIALPIYLMIKTSDIKKCFSLIKNYQLLIREDELFLETWNSEFMKFDKKPISEFFSKCLKWGLLLFSILTSIFMHYILIDYSSFSLFIQLLYIPIFLYAILIILLYSVLSIQFKLSFHIDSLSHNTINVLVLLKKSIRLIQEAELIARGFTAASVTGVVEHIELSATLPMNSCCRQYAELRKRLFSWMKDIFIKYKVRTEIILQNISLDPVVDSPVCLASLSINEFGGLLNLDLDSSELLKITDNFSISSLKTMYHLMEMQISEFFKYLIIISSLVTENRPKDWKQISYARCLKCNAIALSKDMSRFSESLKYTYYYYQSIEATYTENNDVHYPNKQKVVKSSLKVAIHNMSLHLKAALLHSIQIENNLDSEIYVETNLKSIETLQALLKIVKSEVSAFEDNFKESNKIVDNLLNPEKPSTEDVSPAINELKNLDNLPIILEKCDVEREITDEVFEDTITITNKESNKESDFFQKENLKNVEMSSCLLKELKNVLVVKADEHRVREQVALAKKSNQINCIEPHNESEKLLLTPNTVENQAENLKQLEEENEITINIEKEIESEECSKKSVCFIQKDLTESLNFLPPKTDSFANSIALLAAQRQKLLGLSSEEFIDGTDESDSDSDNS